MAKIPACISMSNTFQFCVVNFQVRLHVCRATLCEHNDVALKWPKPTKFLYTICILHFGDSDKHTITHDT